MNNVIKLISQNSLIKTIEETILNTTEFIDALGRDMEEMYDNDDDTHELEDAIAFNQGYLEAYKEMLKKLKQEQPEGENNVNTTNG